MYFVVDLPRSHVGHDVIWMIVERQIKSAHFLLLVIGKDPRIYLEFIKYLQEGE